MGSQEAVLLVYLAPLLPSSSLPSILDKTPIILLVILARADGSCSTKHLDNTGLGRLIPLIFLVVLDFGQGSFTALTRGTTY